MDNPLLLNEIVSCSKKVKKNTLIFKVDFNKAFESVSWEFMDSVMDQMDFGWK